MNRRLYAALFRVYRAAFPAPVGGARASSPVTPRRVLVVQHYGVGDMILTTPLLAFLKDQLPDAEIDVLASSRNVAVLAEHPAVARVFIHDHKLRGWARALPRLRARRYDLILSGQAGKNLREGLTASVIARRHTRKVSLWRPKRYHGLFTTIVRVPPSVTHIAERLLYMGHAALRGPGPRPTVDSYPLCFPSDPRADAIASAFITDRRLKRYAVVNVAAHFAVRDWAPESCAPALSLLLDHVPDMSFVLSRAPGKEAAAAEVVARCASPRVVMAPAMPLLAVGSLVRGAVAVLTTETSLIHVASACHRPVLALYAPVVPRDVAPWLPVGVPHRVLASPLGRTVAEIPTARIVETFEDLLREVAPRGAVPPSPVESGRP